MEMFRGIVFLIGYIYRRRKRTLFHGRAMPADYGRIHRLLKILMHIQAENGWTAKRLALECSTTERNIYRDLKMLEGAGVPYSFDKETNGYRVGRDFFMPSVSLTLEESLALVALAEHVGGREQVPFTTAAAKAISKVRCSLPQKVQDELVKLDDRVAIQLAAVNPPEGTADVYQTMRGAMANRYALLCNYESASTNGDNKPTADFLFKPYTLFFSTRAWYGVSAIPASLVPQRHVEYTSAYPSGCQTNVN